MGVAVWDFDWSLEPRVYRVGGLGVKKLGPQRAQTSPAPAPLTTHRREECLRVGLALSQNLGLGLRLRLLQDLRLDRRAKLVGELLLGSAAPL